MLQRFYRIFPSLSKIFQPKGGRGNFVVPEVLGDTVLFTHDFLGTIPYEVPSVYDLLGAADSLSITSAVPVPAQSLWLVDEMGVFTDDNTPRQLVLYLHYVNAAGDFSVPIKTITSGNYWVPVERRIIMPPGAKIELTAPALTLGRKIRLTFSYLEVPVGQFVPKT